jgi:Recombination endonuclease VII.
LPEEGYNINMCEAIFIEQPIALKTCTKCHIAKPLGEFNKDGAQKDGLEYRCKKCKAKAKKALREKNKAREVIVIPDFKTCPGCKTKKSSQFFNKDKSQTDGLQNYCKECTAKVSTVRDRENRNRENFVVPEFKTCPICKIEKLSSHFHKAQGRADGLEHHCKECTLVNERKRKYGASPEWVKATLEAQGGACAICKFIPGPGDRGLDLDHVHGGGPRGFLHNKCNRGLGFFRDDVAVIGKAIDYLNGPTTGIVYEKSWIGNGIPTAIRDKILTDQSYMCKICSMDLTNRKACIDHDHIAMIIRGILCDGCNCGLGMFDDSVILLTNAIGYLQRFAA